MHVRLITAVSDYENISNFDMQSTNQTSVFSFEDDIKTNRTGTSYQAGITVLLNHLCYVAQSQLLILVSSFCLLTQAHEIVYCVANFDTH